MLFRTPFFLPWLYPNLVWRIPTRKNELYLTFDDGPVPGPTEFVLRELSRRNAAATFFCIGDNVRKHPGIFQKMVEGGHAIGNHTFNHVKGWNSSVHDYLENISRCKEEFLMNGSPPPSSQNEYPEGLFRPPYGRIKRSQINLLTEYQIIMWDVLTHDYAQGLSPEKCLNGSIQAVRPGSIVVFHDSLKAEKNMTYALPRFIDHCTNLGYTFKTLPNS